jgi:Flp pilus assembly pilin Flp
MKKFIANRSGATAIEYALMMMTAALMIITALGVMGTRTATSLDKVNAGFDVATK